MLRKFFHLLNKDLEESNNIANAGLSNLKNKKIIQVGNYKVKIDRKIAEGGFADIFRVNDVSTFSELEPYALKRMFIHKAQDYATNGGDQDPIRLAYDKEINILNNFAECKNMIKLQDN